jgi:hypothetical protein
LRGIALQDKQYVAKIERLVPYEKLPRNLQSEARAQRAAYQLYLVDEKCRTIKPADILGTASIWLIDLSEPNEYEYEVEEILYRFNNRWRLRPIGQRHRLPCEYMAVPRHPTLPVKKVFLDLYYDDFGTF